jgi:hypothetical protein
MHEILEIPACPKLLLIIDHSWTICFTNLLAATDNAYPID